MKITKAICTPVHIPMEAPLRWSMGVENGTTRTIIELHTDEGLIGLGETYGGASTVERFRNAAPFYVGYDPLEVSRIVKNFEVFRTTSEQSSMTIEMRYVAAAIEMACWDLIGKIQNKRVCDLWGGADSEQVPFVAYLFYRYKSKDGKIGGEDGPAGICEQYADHVQRFGFKGLKLKTGVCDPKVERATVKALREKFGDQIEHLRVDPNQVWSTETSINELKKLSEYDLEYCEDPTYNLEGMSRVRAAVPVPLATNMAVLNFDQVAPMLRMRSLDVILVDPYFWGGITQCKKLAAVAETFGFGLAIHSDRELGIGMTASLNLWATTPALCHKYDSHYPFQVDDIITQPLKWKDGSVSLPKGPGLGVEIDREKLEKYHRLYQAKGDEIEFFDPRRPGWIPHVPLW
jgi:glucarate dehydratase